MAPWLLLGVVAALCLSCEGDPGSTRDDDSANEDDPTEDAEAMAGRDASGRLDAGTRADGRAALDARTSGDARATLDAADRDDARAALDAAPRSDAGNVEGLDAAADARADGASADGAPPRDSSVEAGALTCADCCLDGFPRGTKSELTRRITSFKPSPEGVAVCPNGEVFVALGRSGDIFRVALDGSLTERWASLGAQQPAGITCDEQGRLFVAIFYPAETDPPTPPTIVMIDGKDRPPMPMPAPTGTTLEGLNGIVAVAGLGVYASDTPTGQIIRLQESEPGTFRASVAASGVDLANGLAFDPASRKLYVVLSLDQSVVSFDVAADGSLGARSTTWTGSELLGFADGVAVDEAGTLYIASHLSSAVFRSSDGARVAAVGEPASLAFHGGTLLITDFKAIAPDDEGGLYAVDLGICGARPATGL